MLRKNINHLLLIISSLCLVAVTGLAPAANGSGQVHQAASSSTVSKNLPDRNSPQSRKLCKTAAGILGAAGGIAPGFVAGVYLGGISGCLVGLVGGIVGLAVTCSTLGPYAALIGAIVGTATGVTAGSQVLWFCDLKG